MEAAAPTDLSSCAHKHKTPDTDRHDLDITVTVAYCLCTQMHRTKHQSNMKRGKKKYSITSSAAHVCQHGCFVHQHLFLMLLLSYSKEGERCWLRARSHLCSREQEAGALNYIQNNIFMVVKMCSYKWMCSWMCFGWCHMKKGNALTSLSSCINSINRTDFD